MTSEQFILTRTTPGRYFEQVPAIASAMACSRFEELHDVTDELVVTENIVAFKFDYSDARVERVVVTVAAESDG